MLSREQFQSLLGPLREPLPPAAQIIERQPKPGYEQVKIHYDVDTGERISAYVLIPEGVSSCGCVSYKDSFDREIGIQPEFCVPGFIQHGDIEDVVKLVAPRALYLSATTHDKYSRGAERIFEYARSAFPTTNIKCKVWTRKHVFTAEMRQSAYQFLADRL